MKEKKTILVLETYFWNYKQKLQLLKVLHGHHPIHLKHEMQKHIIATH